MKAPKAIIYIAAVIAVVVTLAILLLYLAKSTSSRLLLVDGFGVIVLIYAFSAASFFVLFIQIGLLTNGLFDKSKSRRFETTVVAKRNFKNIHGRKRFLDMRDWRNPTATVQFRASQNTLDTTAIGTPVRVITKSGFLGYEWIVNRSMGTP